MSKKVIIYISIILMLGLVANAQAALEGYWPFDEGSGNTVFDHSGNGRDGMISGASWHSGGWDGTGWALDFDGSNDVVELGAFDVVGPGITLAAWIRPDDFFILGHRIISKASEWDDNSHWWMLSTYNTLEGRKLRFRLKTTDGMHSTTMTAGSGVVQVGQWQHAAATWDGATMRLYLDGVEVGSVAKGGSAVATNSNVSVAIGSQPSDAFDSDPSHVVKFWDGLIDDVRIYNNALSQSEIDDLISGSTPPAPPANDNCDSAQPVGNVTNLPFDTTNATFDGPGLCMVSNNIWYRYTATCTGEVTVSLCGSSFDTMLAVYNGISCYPSSNDLIDCDDDTCDRQSESTFNVIAGSQYLIEVGGYESEAGPGVLSISCSVSPPPPVPNDNCQNAQSVGNVTNLSFNTTNATFDGPGSCMTSKNIWYRYTATCTGEVTVSLCGSSFDTMLAVYRGFNCYPSTSSRVGCNDDACDRQSELTFSTTAGSQYLIEVGGYDNEFGQGVLSIKCEASAPPTVPNDNCQNAQSVGNVTNLSFDTTNATFDGPGSCMTSKNIWYRYTATCTGEVTVSLCGSSFDTMLAVYRGFNCYPSMSDRVGCNDDVCDRQSELNFEVIAGSQYLIEVGGYGSEFGQGVLSIKCEASQPPTVPNDNCQNAQPVGNVNNLSFDTTYATFDGPGSCMTSKNIWYRYTATCTGEVTVSLCGSSFDTMLAVYRGFNCYPSMSDRVGCNDDACNRQSELTFEVTAGSLYLIEVGGYGSEFGQGVLSISCESSQPPTVPNDNCQNAQSVGNVTNLSFDTTNATFDGPGLCMTSKNIWYRYTATCTGQATVSLCGSSFDTMLAVYRGFNCYPSMSDRVGCNDDACDRQSELTFNVTAGSQYLIEVGGYDNEFGQGVLSIICSGSPPSSAPNDYCQNAMSISNVTNLPFDTTNATFDGPGLCMYYKNIWYRYTATCTGQVTVSLCGSSYDTMLAVYRGFNCYPSASDRIGCNDDACDRQSELTFNATVGSQYLIEVGGYSYAYGPGVLSISCSGSQPPSAPNDYCHNAQSVGNVTNLSFNTTNATFDGPGSCMSSKNIWYRYTATCNGEVTVSLCGSAFDTMLAVYNGGSCYPTTNNLIDCDDDTCNRQSEITFTATAGNQYLIEVGGYEDEYGQGILSISCEASAAGESDLGDAPDSTNNYATVMTAYPKGGPSGIQANYPTVFNDGGTGPYGPIHLNPQAVAFLGDNVSREDEADIGLDEDGVNNIEPQTNAPDNDGADDGVVFPVSMPHCQWSTFDYTVNVINPGTNLWVNVWCDWNRDGDWNDDSSTNSNLKCVNGFVSEWTVQNQYLTNLSAGLHQITTPAFIAWHPQGGQQLWMRITLSEKAWKGGVGTDMPVGGSGPEDGYEFGETEDYYFLPETK